MSGHPADWRREIPHKGIPKESVAKTASINSILDRCGSSVHAPRALALHIYRHYQIAVHTREHLNGNPQLKPAEEILFRRMETKQRG